MQDKLLSLLFEDEKANERWLEVIHRGHVKGITHARLLELCSDERRAQMYRAIRDHQYRIFPPHTAQIPKDTPGEFRTVYVNEDEDRVLLSLINNLLFELCPEMVHPSCYSYKKNVSCEKAVRKVSSMIADAHGKTIGWKSDLSKYFDSVPVSYIDGVLDEVERRHGKSALIDVVRDYYHSDLFFNEDNELCESYQSLKQGCAVAAFLADAVIYHIDEKLSGMDGFYIRYSDDMVFVGPDHEKAMETLREELEKMGMKLNPKKIEALDENHWFVFLGFAIRGKNISFSVKRIKTFQNEIMSRTVLDRNVTYKVALKRINRFLYVGNGEHSWATLYLRACNVVEDLNTMNEFAMDCLRAVQTKKRKVGGLGFVKDQKVGCVSRGRGQQVSSNRHKVPHLEGYLSMRFMQNALHSSRAVYNTLTAQM